MSRTFKDEGLLTWEVFPSGDDHGHADHPHLVFNCLSNRMTRPRWVDHAGDEADAERIINAATEEELRALLAKSTQVD